MPTLRSVSAAVLVAGVLHAGLALLLEALAVWAPASIRPWQMLTPSGAWGWSFAPDAAGYHAVAVQALTAWQTGGEFPRSTGTEFFVLTAALYGVLGSSPLVITLLNALAGAGTVWLGARLTTRLGGSGVTTAWLIALWPSGILWSSVGLKDTIALWLTLLALECLVADRPLMLTPAALGLAALRPHFLILLIPAALVLMVSASWRRRLRVGLACALLAGAGTAWRHVDLEAWVSPVVPHVEHVRAGLHLHGQGWLDAAAVQYRAALALRREYVPAWRNLAAVELRLLERVSLAGARVTPDPKARVAVIESLTRYLSLVPSDQPARVALAQIRDGVTPLPSLAPLPVGPGPSRRALLPERAPDEAPVPTLYLGRLRQGIVASGGTTLDPGVRFDTEADLMRYLPWALHHALLAPAPWQRLPAGVTGGLRWFAGAESLLILALLPPIGLGAWRARREPATWLLLVYAGLSVVLLGLVMANLGTLFRLRLEFWLPLLVLAGVGLQRRQA